MNNDVLKKCYERLELRERVGAGNMIFKYFSSKDVIHRMNMIFSGNWSTEALSYEVIEDQVLIRARVCIIDPDTGKTLCHEGFGSHPIARYNSGPNAGKSLSIGNAYKSAFSKAVANACRMWGVGLFKEDDVEFLDDEEKEVIAAPPSAAPKPITTVMASAPQIQPTEEKKFAPPAVPAAPSVQAESSQRPQIPKIPSVAELPEVKISPIPDTSVPPPVRASVGIPSAPLVASISMTQEKPLAAMNQEPVSSVSSEPNLPSPSKPVSESDLPFSTARLEKPNKLNDVQKVAINGILALRKMTYDQLAAEAFESAGAPGYQYPPLEELTYDEAVVIIKYGNNKFRKH